MQGGGGDWISPFHFSDAFSPKHPVEVAVDANGRNESANPSLFLAASILFINQEEILK